MIAEFIDPAILGFILVGVMLFAIFVGFPISFTLIFLGFVFGYLGFGKLVFYLMTLQFSMGYDRTNTRRRTTLCLYGNYDGTSWLNGKIIFSIPNDVSKS